MISIRLKLFVSYASIIFVTLLMLGWTARSLLNEHFNSFVRRFDMAPPPGSSDRTMDLFLSTIQSSLVYTTLGAGAVAIVLSLLISVLFTRPIKEVIRATKDIAKGNYSRRVNVHANDEIGQLSTALNTMASCLEENQRRQQELVTTMIHELATPLTSITGYLEALNDGLIKGKKRKETLNLIQEEAARLTTMVSEVRELSLLQHPNFEIHPRAVNLHELVDKVVTQMEPQLKAKDLKIIFKSTLENEILSLDRDRMIQVVMNLLSNAIQFSPKKGRITVTLKKQNGGLQLSVKDEGPGIDTKDVPHLFDRFYRTERSRSRKTGGLGIGLAVVKEILDAHKASIQVESSKGKGSRFHITFPATKKSAR